MALREIAIAYARKNQFKLALNMIGKMKIQPYGPQPAIIVVADYFVRSNSRNNALHQRILELGKKTMEADEITELLQKLKPVSNPSLLKRK